MLWSGVCTASMPSIDKIVIWPLITVLATVVANVLTSVMKENIENQFDRKQINGLNVRVNRNENTIFTILPHNINDCQWKNITDHPRIEPGTLVLLGSTELINSFRFFALS